MKTLLVFYVGLTVFILALILISPHQFTKYGDGIVPIIYAYRASIPQYDEELRSIGLSMVEECAKNDHNCIKYKVYDKLKDIRYTEAPILYDPVQTIKDFNSDCKNYAYTYTQLLLNLNEESRVVCSDNHCWSEIEWRGLNISVDLTRKFFGEKEYQDKYVDSIRGK